MSVSPPKEDVDHGGQSRENSEPMDRGDPEAQARELAYEFEVKEQDRWLPIANVCIAVASTPLARAITGLIIMFTICAGILPPSSFSMVKS
ncbi:MAG: hypothetical protein L6R40_001371 [Gallowayella cf. fulva]|nr:MAG: hypothetical protein L6R40_001371 [Xanthomendoza cf. fulva]